MVFETLGAVNDEGEEVLRVNRLDGREFDGNLADVNRALTF